MYIHVLEVVVALLVVATAVQLFRCYRSFYKTTQTPNTPPIVVSHLPKQIEKSYSTTGNILHDYIGEFFIDAVDSTVAKLEEYQVAATTKVKAVESVKLTAAILEETEVKGVNVIQVEKRSNILCFDERTEEHADKSSAEDDDDTVITVMTPSPAPSGVVDNNVMSDKVVHAMLDEAKLVCVS